MPRIPTSDTIKYYLPVSGKGDKHMVEHIEIHMYGT